MSKKETITKPILGLVAILTLAFFMVGCGEDSTDPLVGSTTGIDDYTQLDFNQEYGGLTFTDEPEAFDDEALKALMYLEDGEVVDDPLAQDQEVLQWEAMGDDPSDPDNPTRPRFTFLRLRWGMIHGPDDSLQFEPGDGALLDWTGELHTDRGLVIVRRVLAFERPADHLIFPRLDRQTVAFVSHTAGHFDGLLIQIIERPGDLNGENTEPNQLHINTGPFAGVYEVDELAELDELIEVDSLGNRMQLTGFTLSDISYCPKGFLSGRYRVLPEDAGQEESARQQMGTYAGLWIDLTGRIRGFLRGGYGLNTEGERVFVGKYIGRAGQVRGLIRGSWEPATDDGSLASFMGSWAGSGGNIEGYLGGQAHPVEGYNGGFFEGRWTTSCDEEAEEEVR